MKKEINRETLIQYIYDYGIEKAAEILNVSLEKLEGIFDDTLAPEWQKPSLNRNATIKYLNPVISEFVNNNYDTLKQKYVKNTSNSVFYQTDEDMFHNALIKVCSDLSNPTEETILKLFDKTFKTIKWRTFKDNSQMRRKEENTKYDNEDGGTEEEFTINNIY